MEAALRELLGRGPSFSGLGFWILGFRGLGV